MPARFRRHSFRPRAVDLQIQPQSTRRYRVYFLCEPSTISPVRVSASRKFAEWGLSGDAASDALILVSELTTNAVRHAGAVRDSAVDSVGRPSFILDLWVAASDLYVAVHDDDDHTPVVRPSSEEAEMGRGLQLVASLADNVWGFYHRVDAPGKVVWAALRLDAGMPATGHAAQQVGTAQPSASGADFRERVRVAHRERLHLKCRTALGNLRRITSREPPDPAAATYDTHPPWSPRRRQSDTRQAWPAGGHLLLAAARFSCPTTNRTPAL